MGFRVLPRRRGAGVVLSVALAVAAVVAVGRPAIAAPSQADDDLVAELDGWDEPVDIEAPPWEEPEPAALAKPEAVEPLPDPVFPEADSWSVPIDADNSDPAAPAVEPGAGRPVAVGIGAEQSRSRGNAVDADVQVEVLDRAAARRLGVSGFAMALTGTDGTSLADIGQGRRLPASLAIDYSGFAEAYGGDYASRLQVVAVPACALQDPLPDGCWAQRRHLESSNDLDGQTLKVEVDDLASLAGELGQVPEELVREGRPTPGTVFGADDIRAESDAPEAKTAALPEKLEAFASSPDEPASAAATDDDGRVPEDESQAGRATEAGGDTVVLAVTSSASSDMGTYEATPLSVAGEWNVAPGTGEFSYSYPIDVPAPGAGSGPSVSMGYSSGAIDGMTLATNSQAGQSGVGWGDFANGFIERSYHTCSEGGIIDPTNWAAPSLCWKDHNATISLGPVSGNLVPLDTQHRFWRVENDAGWRIERRGEAGPAVEAPLGSSEYWIVTGPDGTQYWFGLHYDPDTYNPSTDQRTLGSWWVPIIADSAGEPCWDRNALHVCNVPWRWNLDRVVDPNGNKTTYWYSRETNSYQTAWGKTPYIQSGMLDRIEYGGVAGTTLAPAGQVVFEHQNRCVLLVVQCPAIAAGSTSYYDDVPVDLYCGSQATCPAISPVFFSSRRYSAVRTEVRVGSAWQGVNQDNLIHTFIEHNASGGAKLYLTDIQHVGIVGANSLDDLIPYPNTEFGLTQKVNRIGVTGQERMVHWRITSITNPFGGTVNVTYGQPRACTSTYQPPNSRWGENNRDCFPQWVRGADGFTRNGIFNKYLVQSVAESPGQPASGAESMTTTYTYGSTEDPAPAWAYSSGALVSDNELFGWTNWRGYGTVTVTRGATDPIRTRVRLFRGMDGDRIEAFDNGVLCACGLRDVDVPGLLNPAQTFPDLGVLAGRALEEQALDASGNVVTATLSTYVTRTTTPHPDYAEHDTPTWAGLASTTESVRQDDASYRKRGGTTTYNTSPAPQPINSEESGWQDVNGDERCSITEYADPAVPDQTGTWMWLYPKVNRRVAGVCATAATGQVLSQSETAYDGQAVGVAPTKGNVTTSRSRVDATTWSESRTTYDGLGRPTQVIQERGAIDLATRTSYTAAATNQIPTGTTVTENAIVTTPVTLPHEGPELVTTTTYSPAYGGPTRIDDPNGSATTFAYDVNQRLIAIRLPTEQGLSGNNTRSLRFSYAISANKSAPPIVKSEQLASVAADNVTGRYEPTWVVYDGLLRQRQSQVLSPTSGSVIVTSTSYNDRGMVYDEMASEAVAGSPGSSYLIPASSAHWQNRTRHQYDALGRSREEQQITYVNGAGTPEITTTSHTYGDDTVTVTGPTGTRSRETIDGLGRTTSAGEWNDADADDVVDANEWDTASYVYNLADQMLSMTDPAGNQTSYTYNMAGWRLSQDDPNRGPASYTYDVAGNPRMAQDALGNQIWTTYDVLGRTKARRSGSDTGTLLASWTYDSATEGLGLPATSTRHTASGNWTTTVAGYDTRGRGTGTSLTVPAGVPGLTGTYSVGQTYDRADRAVASTYSAAGGLPVETVTTSYDTLGMAYKLEGAEPYVRGFAYDSRGRPAYSIYGPPDTSGPLDVWQIKYYDYNAEQQLSRVHVYNAAMTTADDSWANILDRTLAYDDAGNLTERASTVEGRGAARECFDYDTRMRLVRAWTVALSGSETCAAGTTGSGADGYTRHYVYSPDNRRYAWSDQANPTTLLDLVVANFPAAGADRPHAPTSVDDLTNAAGPDTYSWDANGNLASRTVAGTAETFTWDAEQRLASVDGPGTADSSFVYDVDGSRLLRTTAAGRTLYFAGQEIEANPSGSTVTATRTYGFNGELVATRSPSGVQYLITDERGSVELAAPSSGVPSATRSYDPYGEDRAGDSTGFATDRGYIGQIEDDSTGLSYLNARYYDTDVGVLAAPDPVLDPHNIDTLNPYTYTAGNPVTMADPSGMVSATVTGMERQVNGLLKQNRELIAHIGQLNGYIAELQGIIRQQQNYINQLVTQIEAMEAVIRQQNEVIHQLEDRVRYLTSQVNYWRGQAMYWRGQAMYWKGQAIYWYGKAMYYRNVAMQLVDLAYLPQFRDQVKASIDAGNGLPNLWLGTYQAQSMALQARYSSEMGRIDAALGLSGGWHPPMIPREQMIDRIRADLDAAGSRIDDLEADISDLEAEVEGMKWCNTLTVAGSVSSAYDVGSNVLNVIPVVGQIADWGNDKITDVADGLILEESIRNGCVSSAASNMGLP